MSDINKKIVIIDYQLGNLFSVNQALSNIGLDVTVSSDPEDIKTADAIVLPGVGAFKDAMENLKDMQLVDPIKDFVASGKPFLGICLGLQLLFEESEEFGAAEGLGLIKGKVKKFDNCDAEGNPVKVPQIAWNQVSPASGQAWKGSPLENTKEGEYLYFVHSFYVAPEEEVGLTTTTYGGKEYVSSVLKENMFACQFHPEKSAAVGLDIYKSWAKQNNLL